jgi:hypothetical protein
MAINNISPCANFAQHKFHLEFSNFLEHVKETYPSELNQVNNLSEKFKLFIDHSLMSIDVIDELNESLAKAQSLVAVAMACSDLTELDTKTINNYLWVLEDLLTNAQKVITHKNP